MIEFDHIGMIADDKKKGEIYVEATRVWVTDFREHPFRIEWLRFEPDTPVTGPVRSMPHLAFRTDSIAESSKGMTCLLEPFDTTVDKCFLYGSTRECADLIESLQPEVDNFGFSLPHTYRIGFAAVSPTPPITRRKLRRSIIVSSIKSGF